MIKTSSVHDLHASLFAMSCGEAFIACCRLEQIVYLPKGDGQSCETIKKQAIKIFND